MGDGGLKRMDNFGSCGGFQGTNLIQSKVDLYEVCVSLFQMICYCYYFCTNNNVPSASFVVSITLWEISLVNIGQ